MRSMQRGFGKRGVAIPGAFGSDLGDVRAMSDGRRPLGASVSGAPQATGVSGEARGPRAFKGQRQEMDSAVQGMLLVSQPAGDTRASEQEGEREDGKGEVVRVGGRRAGRLLRGME